MASVVWSDAALRHLLDIRDYIAAHDPDAAARTSAALLHAGDSLAHFPNRARPVRGGKRELPSVPPFIIRYRVDGDTAFVIGIQHGRRRPVA